MTIKKTMFAVAILLLTNASFGQAISMPSNSLQFKEFAQNAEPITNKTVDPTEVEEATKKGEWIVQTDTSYTQPSFDTEVIESSDTLVNVSEPELNNIPQNSVVLKPELEFDLYPNPARNNITVNSQFIESENTNLRVFSASGSLIFERYLQGLQNNRISETIDVSFLSAGQYTVILQVGNQVSSKLLVITT
jgi:hypothetical protein